MSNSTYNVWENRIKEANRKHDLWENLFQCTTLEDYWEGKQWKQVGISNSLYKPYVLNLIYSTIKIKLANIIYQNPQFSITPKPGHGDWSVELASRSAEIKEAALNTTIQHPKTYFVKNLRLAALDSFFRFGVLEVGYAADWQNPAKVPLITTAEDDPNIDLNDARVIEDEEVPFNERLFFSHKKARRFRVSTDDSPILDYCNWCGYYSYMRKSTLAKTKGIDLPRDLKNYYFSSDFQVSSGWNLKTDSNFVSQMENQAYCKVWNIWDNVKKEKNLILEYEGWPIIWSDRFERLPFPHVTWDERAPSKDDTGFYPMPPVFQWLSSQDEINQAREQLRNYRKRFVRKFWRNENVLVDEANKLSNNIDGECVTLKGRNTGEQSLGQISNPEIGVTITDSIQISSNDLNLITGTSANARQAVDRTTATESRIIDIRAQVRESVEQMDFSAFVTAAGREGLLTMNERFSEGMWIKLTLDPEEQFGSELQDAQPIYQYIMNQEIIDGSYDWDIDINVVNGTPAQMEVESQKFLKFMAIVMQDPVIALSPILIRECASKLGYKNERVIRELQKAATVKLLSMQSQMSGGGGNGAAQSMSGNAAPNPTEEITSQLQQQLGS